MQIIPNAIHIEEGQRGVLLIVFKSIIVGVADLVVSFSADPQELREILSESDFSAFIIDAFGQNPVEQLREHRLRGRRLVV